MASTTAKRILLLIVGWAFILLGIIGLFLPVLQGVLFLLIGLMILSGEYVWAHHLLRKLKLKFPGIARQLDRAEARAKAWQERFLRKHATSQSTSDQDHGPKQD